MRIRVLAVTAALAVAGACAHGSTRSDTVSDEVLARVPADQMASVNQGRLDVSRAQDTLGREKLRLEQARKFVDVASNEVTIAKAQLDRDQAAAKAADDTRDQQGATQAQSAMGLARQRQEVAEAHVKAANDLVSYSQERVNAAEAALGLANARLELDKYKAVQTSGDKSVADIDGAAIQKKVEDARVALEQERSKVAAAKASASASRSTWVTMRDQLPADQRFGVGGSGSDTAANLSGREETNRTNGQENYDIDTQNTDPNRGRTSNDPNSYDDKELFNLL